MSSYLGDLRTGKVVRKMWNSNAIAGESITLATNGTVSVYKDGGTTQSTTGVTLTEDFDFLTGVHLVAVDTSADGTFYSAGSDFEVVLSGATIDGKAINATLFSFSLENRSALMPTTAGRTLDVSAGGAAGVDWTNVESPTTTLNLSGTTVKTATDVETDTADIQGRLPAALVSGRIDSSTGAMASNVVTAAALATDAVAEITDAVWEETLTDHSGTSGSTAEALGAAGSAGDPWLTALPGAYGSGTAGKIIGDNINATISSRLAGASYTAPPTVGQIADQVWEEDISDHSGTSGSTAEALNAAGSAGNPWIEDLPGAYSAGQAGYILGTNLDALVSSRLALSSITLDSAGNVTVGTNEDKTDYDLSAAAVQAVWDAQTSALTTTGSIGKRLVDNIDVPISWVPNNDTPGTVTLLGRLTAPRATALDQLINGLTISLRTLRVQIKDVLLSFSDRINP